MCGIRFGRTIAILGIVFSTYATTSRGDEISDQLTTLAQAIWEVAKANGVESVTLKVAMVDAQDTSAPVIAEAQFPLSGVTQAREIICAELQKAGITVRKVRARHEVLTTIEIDAFGNPASSQLRLQFKAEIREGQKEIKRVSAPKTPQHIEDQGEIAAFLGVPTDFSSSDHSSGLLMEAIEAPAQKTTTGTVARSTADSPYGVELIVNGKPREIELEDGLAVVPLQADEEFGVRLVNDSDMDAAIQLLIDGIDSLKFSTTGGGYWIVKARSSYTVPGWQKGKEVATKFRITPVEESIAYRLRQPGEVGTITAAFANAYVKGTRPLSDFPSTNRSINAVGEGAETTNRINVIQRDIGKTKAVVPLRYQKP